ncbi:major facilitator superfamily protein, putative [Ichthyophthirius multifiliis]|uniref:Major facilitator superfamily protein, putative n=1 Tax=Ichthyophthirius multifiliis TaxID=5932 RepID=G0QWX0_ICHMU|nr:major facilitator superfamily protein, putative [Ichthyophthirius multifiliis]EGR30291.1 major facilitator superfamily protein, putative [Ichthyophthirius multifiliis]|eukprot:XP_004031878.1 major facilitator superfamily protein, putative [Ichthyophthirius multifiliis]
MISVPFWIGMTAPVYGIIADKFGRRVYSLLGTILIGMTTISLLFIIPGDVKVIIIYISLIMLGVYIASLSAYLMPCYPLICERRFVGTAFDKKKGGKLNSRKPKIQEETREIISRLQSFVQ